MPDDQSGNAPAVINPTRARSAKDHAARGELIQRPSGQKLLRADRGNVWRFWTPGSLIGAAYGLGFTLSALAQLLNVTEGSERNQTGHALPMLRSACLALLPDEEPTWATAIEDPEHRSERETDVLELLGWHLRIVGGDNA
jgi:hypothetical protein